MRKYFFTILFLALLVSPVATAHAATVAPIKILIVPGHDNEVWGAQYGNVKEADMNLRLATNIYNSLKKDKRFKIYITRDIDSLTAQAGYTKTFSDYFTNHREEIIAFKENAKKIRQDAIDTGNFLEKENAPHVNASEDMAIKLYGINKWADENKMDAVIHVHFNDYPRKTPWTKGIHKGFAMYIPETQMVNSKESTKLAKSIFTQLHKKYATSTYSEELDGLVPDQSLIALGSNGTLLSSVRSVLIEYGYIYRFPTKKSRDAAYIQMASLTTTGIKNYFFPTK